MSVIDDPQQASVSVPPGPIVTLRYRVPPEQRDPLFRFLSGAIPLYESPGGIAVGLYESRNDMGSFLELVAYASDEAFRADQERVSEHPKWKEALARWREVVGGPIEVGLMNRVKIAPSSRPPSRQRRKARPRIVPATEEAIAHVWAIRWGIPVITPSGIYRPADVAGVALEGTGGAPAGLVTWVLRQGEAELISVDTLEEGRGEGSRLLVEAERLLQEQGAAVVRLVTSNDNLRAAAFYQVCGYRLVRLHLGAVDAVRRQKPGVPATGLAGLPLRDLWEFEKRL